MYSDDENIDKKNEVVKVEESSTKAAKADKLLDSSDEDEIDESLPNYCEELFRFKKETKKKIEEFKDARSKYIFEENFHPSTSNRVHEGDSDSEIYNGRCILLRKMRFKTGRLRSHYKSLRPFKNYTLNRQISSSDAPPDDKDDKETVENNIPVFQLDKTKVKSSQQSVFASIMKTFSATTSEVDITKKVESTQALKRPKCKRRKKKKAQKLAEKREKASLQRVQNTGSKEEIKSILSETKSLKKQQKKKKKEERKLSSRVLDNLNIDKPGHKYLEPCLCDNGKEVTVVIKGFCLCKKMKQGKHRFQRVCEQYAKPYFGKPCSAELPPQEERRPSDKKRVSLVGEEGEIKLLSQTSEEKFQQRRRISIAEDRKPRTPEPDQREQEAGPPPAKDEQNKLEPDLFTKVENEKFWLTQTTPDEWKQVKPVKEEKKETEQALPVEVAKVKKEEYPPKEEKKERRERASTREDEKKERRERTSTREDEKKERRERASTREDGKEGKVQVLSPGDRKEKKEPVTKTEVAKDKKKPVAPVKEERDKEEIKEKKKTKEEIEDDGKGVLFKSKDVLLGDKRQSGSLRTIFENKPSKRSKMALTKEQLEKMSKITKTR